MGRRPITLLERMGNENMSKKGNWPHWHDGGFPLGPTNHGWRIKVPQFKVVIERVVIDPLDTKKWREDNA